MALSEERRATLLAYCRIEKDELSQDELTLVDVLYSAAVDYMKGAGVSQPEPGTPRADKYDLCVNYLVLSMWDTRVTSITGAIVTDNPMFRLILNQLKFTEVGDVAATGSNPQTSADLKTG